MKTALYPGSFDPWHKGHQDILVKALSVFDKVIVAVTDNHAKKPETLPEERVATIVAKNYGRVNCTNRVKVICSSEMLPNLASQTNADVVIRGIRNGDDLSKEQMQQYWYEDLGMKVPVVYFVSDRTLVHMSSSAVKLVNKFGKEDF